MSAFSERRPTPARGFRSRLRLLLGNLQMFGACLSLVLLFSTGITKVTATAVVLTCIATSVSVWMFGRRD